jgi:hypothetical protein
MKHTINGKRYEIKYTDNIPGDELGLLCGLCDAPDTKGKTIYIRNGLPFKMHIQTLIHETMHACLWCLSEEAVEQIEADLTDVLIKELGMKEA